MNLVLRGKMKGFTFIRVQKRRKLARYLVIHLRHKITEETRMISTEYCFIRKKVCGHIVREPHTDYSKGLVALYFLRRETLFFLLKQLDRAYKVACSLFHAWYNSWLRYNYKIKFKDETVSQGEGGSRGFQISVYYKPRLSSGISCASCGY